MWGLSWLYDKYVTKFGGAPKEEWGMGVVRPEICAQELLSGTAKGRLTC